MLTKTQTIDAWLKTHGDHQPSRVALSFEDHDLTYRELEGWVAQIASYLHHDLSLKRGDRLAFYGKNSDIEVALMFAAARLGLIFVPLNWRLEPAELNVVLKDCGPRVLFHADEYSSQAEAALKDVNAVAIAASQLRDPPQVNPLVESAAELSDPFLIVYTSGTTGRPKGAVITQEAVLWNAIISVHAHDFTARDHTLNLLPLFHVGGINIQMMPTFFVGGQVTLLSAFDPDLAIKALAEGGVTSTVCVPTVMKALLAHPDWADANFPALRLINTGSTDVPVEILSAVNASGIPMVQVYGTTETGPIATYQKLEESQATIGSIGRCGAHTAVSIRRDDGSQCEHNEAGEIWVKGPNNFSHYWNAPEATADALLEGWFKTGDIGSLDEGGLFWFSGRSKHVIISGGENIYPAELDRVVSRMPGVIEVAVVGRPDAKWGEVPVAAVVIEPSGPSKAAILAEFKDRVARFKHPRDVVFLDALPKNALGKILVEKVRELVV